MVTSTLGFLYSGDNSNTKKEEGLKFVKTESGMWRTYIDSIGSYWDFNYLPSELSSDDYSYFVLSADKVYLYTENSNDSKYIDKFKLIFLYTGIVVEEVDTFDCSSNTKTYILDSTKSSIEVNNNCIYLNGNLNKYLDGLTYKVFGVI